MGTHTHTKKHKSSICYPWYITRTAMILRLFNLFLVAFANQKENEVNAEDEMTEQERFAQEILSLFNYPVYTVLIPAGKYDCYHHVTNESFHFDYSVEGGGNLDIIFEAFSHKGDRIIRYEKNQTGYHLFKLEQVDDIKLCFDNTFSMLTEKKVHFEIFPELDMDEWDGYLKEYQAMKKEKKENGDLDNLMATGDPEWDIIHEKSNDMRKKFRKSLRLLDQMRSQGHRDEALMENKEFRLNFWSITLALLIPLTSFLQILFVRMLFNTKSKISD